MKKRHVVVLALCAIVVSGCGSEKKPSEMKPEELIVDLIKTTEGVAVAFESAKDASSARRVGPRIQALLERMEELERAGEWAFDEISEEDRRSILRKYERRVDAAMNRMNETAAVAMKNKEVREALALTGSVSEQMMAVLDRECASNLRLIDVAKEQAALIRNYPEGQVVETKDIVDFLQDKTMLECPLGGTYSLNPIGTSPTCSVKRHAMP